MTDDHTDTTAFERGISHAADEEPSEAQSPSFAEESLAGLSRRTILGSIAAIGTTGAVTGAGVQSLLYDEEVFGQAPAAAGNAVGNAFNVNVLQSGRLDLKLCWEEPGEDCAPVENPAPIEFGEVRQGDTGSATLRCDIEDNPGWLWFRTGCPVGPCGLEDALRVTLWYDSDCDGVFDEQTEQPLRVEEAGETIDIVNLELCRALKLLHSGILLDHTPDDGDDPIRPNDTCCIGFEWEVVGVICEEDDVLDLEFEFYTEQWRHNMNAMKPTHWQDAECDVDCETECPPCEFQDISFVAFCIEDDGESIEPGEVSFVPHFDADGGAFRIEWESDVGIDWVVLFYGSSDGKFFENFNYDDGDGATSGDVWVNSETNDPDGNDNFHSKLLWGGGQDETDLGQHPTDPCPDLTDTDHGCGVKYEFDDERWEAVCGGGGPGP